jgi:hypothetical protein
MIEKFARVLSIAKFVQRSPPSLTNFAIGTLDRIPTWIEADLAWPLSPEAFAEAGVGPDLRAGSMSST